jgi:predicted DNA-binding protein
MRYGTLVSMRLADSDLEALDGIAQQHGSTRAAAVRFLIRDHLARQAERERLAADACCEAEARAVMA